MRRELGLIATCGDFGALRKQSKLCCLDGRQRRFLHRGAETIASPALSFMSPVAEGTTQDRHHCIHPNALISRMNVVVVPIKNDSTSPMIASTRGFPWMTP